MFKSLILEIFIKYVLLVFILKGLLLYYNNENNNII